MATATRKSSKRQAYVDKIHALQDRLAEWQEDHDDEEIAMIVAGILGYSDRNSMLIAMQRPDATIVRGYNAWIELGRHVNKGAKGIQILAPAGSQTVSDDQPVTREDDNATATDNSSRVRRFFRLAYVFDISDTHELTAEEVEQSKRRQRDAMGNDD